MRAVWIRVMMSATRALGSLSSTRWGSLPDSKTKKVGVAVTLYLWAMSGSLSVLIVVNVILSGRERSVESLSKWGAKTLDVSQPSA